ncbi:hypothetical protein [Rhodococcoides fascians]|uniref:hypothetical protein n=1 Tax=Rhodococcoides fascians TaxID=1828 RepID=UPI00050CF9B2|nr:hypothetical protein [Rhodococcus fascians]
MRKLTASIAAAAAAVAVLAGCSSSPSTTDSANTERASVAGTYDGLVAKQPAHTMSYSPTRETKNFWIDTWGTPGKLSYVYLQGADGKILGYFILKGLPVDKCTSLVPTFDVQSNSSGAMVVTPRPSVDGTYSSGSNCSTYYGEDATTGAYIEWTAGSGQNVLLFDQPMARAAGAPALGASTLESVQNLPQGPK